MYHQTNDMCREELDHRPTHLDRQNKMDQSIHSMPFPINQKTESLLLDALVTLRYNNFSFLPVTTVLYCICMQAAIFSLNIHTQAVFYFPTMSVHQSDFAGNLLPTHFLCE